MYRTCWMNVLELTKPNHITALCFWIALKCFDVQCHETDKYKHHQNIWASKLNLIGPVVFEWFQKNNLMWFFVIVIYKTFLFVSKNIHSQAALITQRPLKNGRGGKKSQNMILCNHVGTCTSSSSSDSPISESSSGTCQPTIPSVTASDQSPIHSWGTAHSACAWGSDWPHRATRWFRYRWRGWRRRCACNHMITQNHVADLFPPLPFFNGRCAMRAVCRFIFLEVYTIILNVTMTNRNTSTLF